MSTTPGSVASPASDGSRERGRLPARQRRVERLLVVEIHHQGLDHSNSLFAVRRQPSALWFAPSESCEAELEQTERGFSRSTGAGRSPTERHAHCVEWAG